MRGQTSTDRRSGRPVGTTIDDNWSAEDSDGDAPDGDADDGRAARRPRPRYLAGPPHDFFDYLRQRGAGALARDRPTTRRASGSCTKYADVIGIERDVKTFSSAQRRRAARRPGRGHRADDAEPGPAAAHAAAQPGGARVHAQGDQGDGAAHPRGGAADRRPRQLDNDDVIDFVPNFAAELPLVVIAELLGIPYEDRHKVFEWSNRLIGDSTTPSTTRARRRGGHGGVDGALHVRAVARRRRAVSGRWTTS